MGIFYGRRLCLFCCLFLLTSLLAWFLPLPILLGCGAALLLVLVIVVIRFVKLHPHPRHLLTGILCLFCVLAALLHTVLWVALPQRRAESYVGERVVVARVIDVSYRSPYSAQYTVQLLQIDEASTDLRASLSCSFPSDFVSGDTVYAAVTLTANPRDSERCLLMVTPVEGEGVAVRRTSQADPLQLLTSDSGVQILSNHVRSDLRERLSSLLGERIGSLASAFLLGDRSELSADITRDFRRAGVSHMMAVSGLHISILLGGIELLLRKLTCHKRLRCVIVAVFGVVFLFLTGFSLSACRSVLMLFFVYVFYLLQEGNDSLTALFASIAWIVLLFPRAVADLGMWMSFLATLGLLTVYPLCERHWKSCRRSGLGGRALRGLRRVRLLALMTVIANLFLLPIMWIFFGELSLVAVPANVLLSFVSYLFLLGIPILLITSWIPLVGEGIRWCVWLLGRLILYAVRGFSSIPNATVSLQYDFCKILIPCFTVAMLVLLVIRLRQKLWLAVPPVLATIVLVIGFVTAPLLAPDPSLGYRIDGRSNEMITVSDGDSFAICDLSGGSVSAYRSVWKEFQATTAVEIQSVMLTHYHTGHLSGLDFLMRQAVIRLLYMPAPSNTEELAVANQIYALARELDVTVRVYYSDQTLPLTDAVTVSPLSEIHRGHRAVSLTFHGEQTTLSYLSSGLSPTEAQLRESSVVLIGSHGGAAQALSALSIPEGMRLEKVVYTRRTLPRYPELLALEIPIYVPAEKQTEYLLRFSLS